MKRASSLLYCAWPYRRTVLFACFVTSASFSIVSVGFSYKEKSNSFIEKSILVVDSASESLLLLDEDGSRISTSSPSSFSIGGAVIVSATGSSSPILLCGSTQGRFSFGSSSLLEF